MNMRKILAYGRILHNWRIAGSTTLGYLPEDISVELTNTCNFKCAFCPQSDPNHFDKVARTTLSRADADTILRKLREGGVRTDVIHWTLDGEPFINRDIDGICEIAIHHGFNVFLFATNGYFLTPERLSTLPTSGNATYTLSVDFCADRDFFETHRGTKTSWERVRDNIRRAVENDRLDHIRFEVTDITSYTVTDTFELDRSFRALKALFPGGRIVYRTRVFHNMAGFIPGIAERKRGGAPRYHLCPYPWTSLVVASNGDVVACCRDLNHETVLGNLLEEDLGEIWNGQRFIELRQNLIDRRPEANGACNGCDLPYDSAKFSARHIVKRAVERLGILK